MQSDPQQFIESSLAGLRQQSITHRNTWRFGDEQRWEADLATGTVTFTFADGTIAVAPMQIVGTYDVEHGSFLWGWEHPSVGEALRTAANLARDWGAANNMPFFTAPMLECSEQAAWEFTAVAARLVEANGAYCGTSGNTRIFLTFGAVSLSKPGNAPTV